jgi:hypothetical protein
MNAASALDEEIWNRLVEPIRAAHEMDVEVFRARQWSFAKEVKLPGQHRAGPFLWYRLRNALGGKVGGRVPTDAELELISCDYSVRFGALVNADRTVLEDTFRSVFERAPLKKGISPAELMALAPPALGVLYDDPDAELSRMKPHLDRWWQKYSEELRSQGCSSARGPQSPSIRRRWLRWPRTRGL